MKGVVNCCKFRRTYGKCDEVSKWVSQGMSAVRLQGREALENLWGNGI